MVGLVSASIAAFLASFGLLRDLENQGTWIFVWYRLIMGVFLLVSIATKFLPN
jgi:undecaprenyl-diphosphatase